MTDRTHDLRYMSTALRLAEQGLGQTSPNPMVGAVVVSKGRIVGQAYHHAAGEPHAEALALKQAGVLAKGATLYITLEPCCHLKKRTPPCVPAVIRSGVRRVVVAMADPNPMVRGRGIAALRRAGISVTTGVARQEAEQVNRAYIHWIRTGRPYVIMKAGMTLDGKLATASGESKWITSAASRAEVHRLRKQVDAVLVGIGTVLADNPELTARSGPRFERLARRQPMRVIVDSRLRIPLPSTVLSGQREAKTVIATTKRASSSRLSALAGRGIETLRLPAQRNRVSMPSLLKELGRRGITSLLVEGGSEVNAALLREKLVNSVRLYLAPALLGGKNARGLIGGKSPRRLAQAVTLRQMKTRLVGPDLLIEGDL